MAMEKGKDMNEEMFDLVIASKEVSRRVKEELGISDAGLSKAFRGKMNGEQAKRARELAMKHGAVAYVKSPLFDTRHEESLRLMVQTFDNGAVVIVDKGAGKMRVEYKGKTIADFYTTDRSHLIYAQLIASQL